MRELRARDTDIRIDAVGGQALARAGANIVETREEFSVVGLVEGIGTISAHLRALRRLRSRFEAGCYDLAVLLDYPGFHLRVAAAASGCGVPVLYYIAPQVWAWGSWRIKSMQKHVHHVAAILPFEEEYFSERGLSTEFVGHPLLDHGDCPSRSEARSRLKISEGCSVLGLLPGSRRSEIEAIWPILRDAAKLLMEREPGLRVLVASMEGWSYPGVAEFRICHSETRTVLAAADAVLCKSGTSTLEAAVAGTPMVIAYRLHPFTFQIAKWLLKVPHVGLVNLVAGREVCPEFLQADATPAQLANAVQPLLDSASESACSQREALSSVRSMLGGAGATRRVADTVERLVV